MINETEAKQMKESIIEILDKTIKELHKRDINDFIGTNGVFDMLSQKVIPYFDKNIVEWHILKIKYSKTESVLNKEEHENNI